MKKSIVILIILSILFFVQCQKNNFEIYQEGLNINGLADNILKLKKWYCGIWIGKDIEIVRTHKIEIKFERDKEKSDGLWSQLSLLRYNNDGLEQNIRALVYANSNEKVHKVHAKNFGSFSDDEPFMIDKELSSKVIANHYNLILTNDTLIILETPSNGKEYIYNSGIIRKFDSNDNLIIELRKIESIKVLHDMPDFEKLSESTIATCLRNWQLGSMLVNDHKNKKILNKALITTNQNDYIFIISDNFCYCRKFRYDTHNKGMAVSRGDIRLMVNKNEFTSYMPEDHINRASQKLIIDESKFDPTKCFYDTGVIYWSLKKFYNDIIELHGCDGMTYPYYLPKSKNSKVEWFLSNSG